VLTANTFVWCEGSKVSQERDLTGHSVEKQFFYQGEQVNGTNYFYAEDKLDNIRELTDTGGVIQASYDYNAFGRQVKLSGTVDSDFGYGGYYVNKTTGLDLTWYRAYDSEKARWLSRDPLNEEMGLNLYEYVNNEPLDYIDPDGRQLAPPIGPGIPWDCVVIGAAVVCYVKNPPKPVILIPPPQRVPKKQMKVDCGFVVGACFSSCKCDKSVGCYAKCALALLLCLFKNGPWYPQ
jgi:RHS repeat-associated protein